MTVALIATFCSPLAHPTTSSGQLALLSASVGAGIVSYALAAMLFNRQELRSLFRSDRADID